MTSGTERATSLFSPPEPENPLESTVGGGDAGGAGEAGTSGGAEAALLITQLVVQPGDGGPMEDWMGLEALQVNDETTIVILNGALDKLRMGYYSPFIFPKLNKVVDRFYRKFETVYYLKPILDKGCYGWLYRVYPEPWQVCFQTSAEVSGVCGCAPRHHEARSRKPTRPHTPTNAHPPTHPATTRHAPHSAGRRVRGGLGKPGTARLSRSNGDGRAGRGQASSGGTCQGGGGQGGLNAL